MALQSYKYKSKIATAVSFIAAAIIYIGKDELAQIMPPEYASLASLIVLIAGYVLTQSTENKRVNIAELLIEAKYNPITDVDPTAEYEKESYPEVGDDVDDQ